MDYRVLYLNLTPIVQVDMNRDSLRFRGKGLIRTHSNEAQCKIKQKKAALQLTITKLLPRLYYNIVF